MAGIGFDLRRVLGEDAGVFGRLRAWASAGLIASGPWLVTMLSLWLVSRGRGAASAGADHAQFLALVTYAFAFSLVTVGAVQNAFTRRLADMLYDRSYGGLIPAFAAAVRGVGAVQCVTGALFCVVAGFDARLAVVWTCLYVVISLTWIALIWLTVIRNYDRILIAFLAGMAVSWLMMTAVGDRLGTAGAIGAFTAGQILTLALLIGLIVRGTEPTTTADRGIFRSLRDYPQLVGAGLLYGLGVWIDKFVFWSMAGLGEGPIIRYHPIYDSCCFLAYLTVVPALAINLIDLETAFYERYRAYYASILAGRPLRVIVEQRRAMGVTLRQGAARLLRLQGAVSLACIVFAPTLIGLVQLPDFAIRVFRLTCFAALFHVLFLIATLIQLYFDLRREALISAAVFCVTNGVLAVWSVQQDRETYGVGYVLAALVSLLVALVLLDRAMRTLEFRTFVTQVRGHDG